MRRTGDELVLTGSALGAVCAVSTWAVLIAMAQTLATELGPAGVRVNALVPGSIWADPLRRCTRTTSRSAASRGRRCTERNAASLDLRQLPEAPAVADAMLFLASAQARAITGQCLYVNGGEYHHRTGRRGSP